MNKTTTIPTMPEYMRGITSKPEYINPDMAAQILKHQHKNQRTVKKQRKAVYQKQMEDSTWVVNGEPIIISNTGILIDGGHRLEGVVESGQGQWFYVTRGVPEEINGQNVFLTIDMDSRSNAEALEIAGYGDTNLKTITTLIRLVDSFKNQKLISKASGTVMNNPDIVAMGNLIGKDVCIELARKGYEKYISATMEVQYNDSIGTTTKRLFEAGQWSFLEYLGLFDDDIRQFTEDLADNESTNIYTNALRRRLASDMSSDLNGGEKRKYRWFAIFTAIQWHKSKRKHVDVVPRPKAGAKLKYPKTYPHYIIK